MTNERDGAKRNRGAQIREQAEASMRDPEYRAEINRVQQDMNGVGLWDLVVEFSEAEFETIKQAALAAGVDMETYAKRAVQVAINSQTN